MGKSLRGKECGKGICQRKDGLYSARFVSSEGKRQVKCFSSLPEARNWLDDAKYADKHENIFVPPDMTVDVWFEFWIENIVGDLAPNTLRNYRERYKQNIQPIIGTMLLSDVKPMHCKKVLLVAVLQGFVDRQRPILEIYRITCQPDHLAGTQAGFKDQRVLIVVVGAFRCFKKHALLVTGEELNIVCCTNGFCKPHTVHWVLPDHVVHHSSPKHRSHSNICLADR